MCVVKRRWLYIQTGTLRITAGKGAKVKRKKKIIACRIKSKVFYNLKCWVKWRSYFIKL